MSKNIPNVTEEYLYLNVDVQSSNQTHKQSGIHCYSGGRKTKQN